MYISACIGIPINIHMYTYISNTSIVKSFTLSSPLFCCLFVGDLF